MKKNIFYNGITDMPILKYNYFVLYFVLSRKTDIVLRGSFENVINEALSIAKFQTTDDLANYFSNIMEGYERLENGITYAKKAFDCTLIESTIHDITDDKNNFIGQKHGYQYFHLIAQNNEFYEKLQQQLLNSFGDTFLFSETQTEMRKDFSKIANNLLMIDFDNENDLNRLIELASEKTESQLNCEYYEDIVNKHLQSTNNALVSLGIDETTKQLNTSVFTYFAKIIQRKRENEAHQ